MTKNNVKKRERKSFNKNQNRKYNRSDLAFQVKLWRFLCTRFTQLHLNLIHFSMCFWTVFHLKKCSFRRNTSLHENLCTYWYNILPVDWKFNGQQQTLDNRMTREIKNVQAKLEISTVPHIFVVVRGKWLCSYHPIR